MITGADLGYEDLSGDAPESVPESPSEEPTEADVATDPDAHFEWPVPAKVAKWWAKRKSGYEFGVRYLRGKPITEATLREALSNGMQNQRAAASLELGLLHPSNVLFETRARADRQIEMLKEWNS